MIRTNVGIPYFYVGDRPELKDFAVWGVGIYEDAWYAVSGVAYKTVTTNGVNITYDTDSERRIFYTSRTGFLQEWRPADDGDRVSPLLPIYERTDI